MPQQEQNQGTNVVQHQQLLPLSPKQIGDKVMSQVTDYCNDGMILPPDYNAFNSIKLALMTLEGVKDRNGTPALQVCTPVSISKALFKMVTKGLDLSLSQTYPVVYGDQLTLEPSYFGNILQVKRLFPDWHPVVRVIHEGDVIEFEINPTNGVRSVKKHEQSFANLDNDFIGAYMMIPTPTGSDLFVMTKKEILSAWAQSKNKAQTTHQKFQKKMVEKTVINSGTRVVINSTPAKYNQGADIDDDRDIEDVHFEEVKDEPKGIAETAAPIEAPKAKRAAKVAESKESDDF